MTIDYLVDIKKESNRSSHILDLTYLESLSEFDLSFAVVTDKINRAIESKDFGTCYKLLNNAKIISYKSDSYFLLDLLVKLEESIYEFKEINLLDYVKVLDWKAKVTLMKREVRLSRTLRPTSRHKELLKELYALDDSVILTDVIKGLKDKVKSEQNVDFKMLDIFEAYKEKDIELYDLLVFELSKTKSLEERKNLFVELYTEEFLKSKEFLNSFNKDENCESLLSNVKKAHLLYKFNQEKNMNCKVKILEKAKLLDKFITLNDVNKLFVTKRLAASNMYNESLDAFIKKGNELLNTVINSNSNHSINVV